MGIYVIEHTILSNLIFDDDFRAKTLPALKQEYFEGPYGVVFRLIASHIKRYNRPPTIDTLIVDLHQDHEVYEKEIEPAKKLIESLALTDKPPDWVEDHTLRFCRNSSLYSAVKNVINILDDSKKDKSIDLSLIPSIFQDALNVGITPKANLVMDLESYISNYVPEDYLVEGVFKQGNLYSLTGRTGAGKTLIALYIALAIALNASVADHTTNGQGKLVVYFAGENPKDVGERLIAMLDGEPIPPNFKIVPHPTRENGIIAIEELKADGRDIAFIVADTSTAYFSGEEENNNKEHLDHAKWLRSMTTLAGNPTVLVCCHPPKNAIEEKDMQPRGGGAFLNELDGNLYCTKTGSITRCVRDAEKYRGINFEPLHFVQQVVHCDKLKTRTGKVMPTVIARLALEEEILKNDSKVQANEIEVLQLLANTEEKMSLRKMAEKLRWLGPNGTARKSTVDAVVKRLRGKILIDRDHQLTAAGKELLAEYGATKH